MEETHESLIPGEILENRTLGSGCFELVFRLSDQSGIPAPGQFLSLRCTAGTSPLLRRPFAYASFQGNTASVIIEKRGPGTDNLSRLVPGSVIDILGPLGRGFRIPSEGPLHLAAGGIGLGPMLYTRSVLKAAGRSVVFVAGFRDKSRVITALPEGEDVVICTDDGSLGFKGTVTGYLETLVGPAGKSGGTILACGPHPMLKACHDLAVSMGLTCQVSAEAVMACGIGACAGCVVPGRDAGVFYRACKDGPVFDSEALSWT